MANTTRKRKRRSSVGSRISRIEEHPGEGGPEEAAYFIAETVSSLGDLTRRHRLDMLGYLLAMVQLEAEEHVRLRSRRKLS
nr:hypothetical protein [Bradyrhizobium sp.]